MTISLISLYFMLQFHRCGLSCIYQAVPHTQYIYFPFTCNENSLRVRVGWWSWNFLHAVLIFVITAMLHPSYFTIISTVMGVLGLGLKESLKTIFKSLALKDKSLALALKVKSLALFQSPCAWRCKSLHLLSVVTRRSFTAKLQQCLCLPIARRH